MTEPVLAVRGVDVSFTGAGRAVLAFVAFPGLATRVVCHHAGPLGAPPQASAMAGGERAGRLAYLTLCDAEAAQQAAAGMRARGHARAWPQARQGRRATDGEGTVTCITDGRFVMGDAGARGSEMALGRCAVLAIGDLRVAIRSAPANEWDTGTFTSVGLDLRHAALAFVTSPSHYRVSYAPLAARILAADTPGATCGNMRKLTFTRVTRPLYPLDIVNTDQRGQKAAREART